MTFARRTQCNKGAVKIRWEYFNHSFDMQSIVAGLPANVELIFTCIFATYIVPLEFTVQTIKKHFCGTHIRSIVVSVLSKTLAGFAG